MPETSPTTRHGSRSVRIGAFALVLAALLLAAWSTTASLAWLVRGPHAAPRTSFPGFLLLPNGLVAAVDLGWSGGRVPGLYGSRVLAVGDRAVDSPGAVY